MSVERAEPSLAEYYAAHRGKVSDKWSSYLQVYQRVFEPYRQMSIRLLEIGIQNGGSLEIWAQYFSKAAAIVGCDINPACSQLRYSDRRVHVVVGDANTDKTEQAIAAFTQNFDIIIDDGSHRSSDIVRSFARYFPRLKLGGVFIAEDLHCSYWSEFEGGLMDSWSSVSFFKRLADVINHEHWGVSYLRSEVLRSFERRYGFSLDEGLLSEIHSIEFFNSVCVVRKYAPCANQLGPRVVVGTDAHVTAGQIISQKGSTSVPPAQSSNKESILPPLPEDELLTLRAKNTGLVEAIAASQRREDELKNAGQALRSLVQQREAESRESRNEHNSIVNATIEAAVRIHERGLAEPSIQPKLAELAHALDARRHENALIQQAGTPLHLLAGFLPVRLKTWIRWVRDEIDIRYLRATSYFDEAWYLKRNPDVKVAGVDPIRHYVKKGVSEGRNPRAEFDTKRYLASRLKTRRPRRNAFVEYLLRHNGKDSLVPIVLSEKTVIDADVLYEVGQAWYGAQLVETELLFKGGRSERGINGAEYERQTQVIVSRYLSDVESEGASYPIETLAPLQLIQEALRRVKVDAALARSAEIPTYSIVTPFFAHLEFFRRTAASVARLIKATSGDNTSGRIEWIIMNDDPRFDLATIEAAIPGEIRFATQILSDGMNRGISERQNQAIKLARNEWVIFLDCDDLLESQSTEVLDHYISQFPFCRFISSTIIDIDENDVELRRRVRTCGSDQLYEKGMNAGHLAAIRRDLFEDIGTFDPRFSGCQDYDLALRIAIREPVLLIPEHLYSYRWHTRSQSVGQFKKQARISDAVRRAFLQNFLEHHWPENGTSRGVSHSNPHGACLIRTQGRRLEFLEEAVHSVLQQTVPITPCIVVHGDLETFNLVGKWASRFDGRVEMLHASLGGRRRGYPLNVGLDFIEAATDRFDFFCILDDDDILYPMFAERLVAALNMSGADVAYCTTNSRVPGEQAKVAHPPLPTAALISGNFIPINAYIVRTTFLKRSGARLREDIHYLEDWDFLLSLMHAGARFTLLNETLSEFRIIGDGNLDQKQDPEHFAHCRKIVGVRAALAAKKIGVENFYRAVMDFDFSMRPALTCDNLNQLQAAFDIFATVNVPLKLRGR